MIQQLTIQKQKEELEQLDTDILGLKREIKDLKNEKEKSTSFQENILQRGSTISFKNEQERIKTNFSTEFQIKIEPYTPPLDNDVYIQKVPNQHNNEETTLDLCKDQTETCAIQDKSSTQKGKKDPPTFRDEVNLLEIEEELQSSIEYVEHISELKNENKLRIKMPEVTSSENKNISNADKNQENSPNKVQVNIPSNVQVNIPNNFQVNIPNKDQGNIPNKVPIKKTKQVDCQDCNKTFASSASLKIHADKFHNQMRKTFQCELCCQLFDLKSSLKKHFNTTHKDMKPFKCQICCKAFNKNAYLKHHIESVHQKMRPSQCSICFKAFPKSSNLKRHVQHIHDKRERERERERKRERVERESRDRERESRVERERERERERVERERVERE
jgi:hypothetical protein